MLQYKFVYWLGSVGGHDPYGPGQHHGGVASYCKQSTPTIVARLCLCLSVSYWQRYSWCPRPPTLHHHPLHQLSQAVHVLEVDTLGEQTSQTASNDLLGDLTGLVLLLKHICPKTVNFTITHSVSCSGVHG